MKNWWHVRCVHFMSKLLIYKQLRLSYSKLSVLIFSTFQFFMFWFKTDFVKWKFQFRNSLFDLKWKKQTSNNIFHFSNLITALKNEKLKRILFLALFWFKTTSKNKNQNLRIHSLISNQKMNLKNFFHFSILVMKLKNEKWNIFKICFAFKSKN